jgi:hypothetical protein
LARVDHVERVVRDPINSHPYVSANAAGVIP